MSSKTAAPGLFNPAIIRRAAIDAFRKLDPRQLARNPVIFVTEIVSAVVTLLFVRDLVTQNGTALFTGQIAAWLWFTVLFANFAEAVAEGRGKAQADALRKTRTDTRAKRLIDPDGKSGTGNVVEGVSALDLRIGELVLVEAGDLIPGDGEVIEGVASVNESAITGESAPVIREAGGDRSAVTGGTTVLSDWIKVKITAAPGSTFIDRMIALVEGAQRQKTPNELALSILLSGLTIIFLIVCVTLWPLAAYSGTVLTVSALIALLVCTPRTTSISHPIRSRPNRLETIFVLALLPPMTFPRRLLQLFSQCRISVHPIRIRSNRSQTLRVDVLRSHFDLRSAGNDWNRNPSHGVGLRSKLRIGFSGAMSSIPANRRVPFKSKDRGKSTFDGSAILFDRIVQINFDDRPGWNQR